MAKKFLIVLLVLLVIGLAGCATKTPDTDTNPDTNTGDNLTPPQNEETKYTLSFVIDGKPVYTVNTVPSATIVLPAAPRKPGKTFVGWYIESQTPLKNKIDSNYFAKNPMSADTTVYGHYVDAAYTVSFWVDGVHQSDLDIVTNGAESIALPDTPVVKDGYTFEGWFLDPGVFFKEVYPDTFEQSPIYENVQLHAHYSVSAEVELFETLITGITECAIVGLGDGVVMNDLVIPEKLVINVGGVDKTYTVTSIYTNAFVKDTNIETVVLPSTITKIYENAFNGCANLHTVYIPSSVVDVDATSFRNTPKLSRVTAPLNVLTHIDKKALVNVEINGGDTISSGMFKNADNLVSIVFNSGLKTVESEAFYDCNKLSTVAFNDGLVTIGANAFYNCDKISEITLSASVASIDESAFEACSGINRIVIDAANTAYESNNSHCIVVKETKKLIFGCKNTVIYEGILAIGEYAFLDCTGLKSIYLPWTVESVADGAFAGCTSLELINVQENNVNYISVNNCLIELVETSEAVINKIVLGCQNSVITEIMNIAEISSYAFNGCINLTEIYLPSTVSTIVAGSFDGCTGLKKVVINNPELVFEGDVFATCTAIDTVVLPLGMSVDSVKDSGVFSACRSLKNLTVTMDLVPYFLGVASKSIVNVVVTEGAEVADGLFSACTNLAKIDLPASVTAIGDAAFEGCKQLTSVKLAKDSELTSIGYNAFRDCAKLTTFSTADVKSTGVVVPAGVAEIGVGAFYNTAISSLNFADGAVLASIGYNVFAKCSSLDKITIPAVVVNVDYSAFEGSDNITEATIPADVIRCLGNCKKLATLNVSSGTKIDNYALCGLTSLRTLTICSTITKIDNRVFEGCTSLTNISVDADNTFYTVEGKCLIEIDNDGLRTVVLGVKGAVIPGDVVAIAPYAFSKSTITSITIPDSVEVIGEYAFYMCKSLTTLTIDGDVTVAAHAFDGCTNIEKAAVPTYVIADIFTAKLKNLTITTGEEVPAGALKDCVTLVTLNLSEGIVSIADYAFFGCNNLVNVTIPDSVTSVGAYAFSECDKLETVKIGAGVKTIGAHAFYDCAALANVNVADLNHWCTIVFADEYSNPIVNGGKLYANNVYVTELIVDETAVINSYAFYSYKGISNLVIPDYVSTIAPYAFAASSISSLVLGDRVTVEAHAFDNCANLNYLEVGEEVVIHEEALCGNVIKSAKLPVYALSLVDLSSLEVLEIASGDEIGANALDKCLNIHTLIVHDGVTTIDDNAFAGCTTIKTVTGPFSVLSYIYDKTVVETIVITSGEVDNAVLDEFTGRKEVVLPA